MPDKFENVPCPDCGKDRRVCGHWPPQAVAEMSDSKIKQLHDILDRAGITRADGTYPQIVERLELFVKIHNDERMKHMDTLASLLVKVEKVLPFNATPARHAALEELRGDMLEAITGSRKLTCDTCDSNLCEYKGDFYNTNGDCLRDK